MRVAPKAVQDLPCRLPASQRLLRNSGFDHVFKADNIADRSFKIFFVKNSQDNARLGMVVSKKKLPGAVYRNHIKRIIREVFRHHRIKLCNLDVVVMLRHFHPQDNGSLNYHLNTLFSRIENRCAEP